MLSATSLIIFICHPGYYYLFQEVFEKQFSQLHFAALCLPTVNNLFSMSQAISLKITLFQTDRNVSPRKSCATCAE